MIQFFFNGGNGITLVSGQDTTIESVVLPKGRFLGIFDWNLLPNDNTTTFSSVNVDVPYINGSFWIDQLAYNVDGISGVNIRRVGVYIIDTNLNQTVSPRITATFSGETVAPTFSVSHTYYQLG